MGIPFAWLKAPAAWKKGPLITPDANTVAHVYWRNGALVDLEGNTWNMQGAVPQVLPAQRTPPGAGPFSAANYYTIAGTDVLDFSGAFSACLVLSVTTSGTNIPFTNGVAVSYAGGVSSPAEPPLGTLSAVCFGRSGTTAYIKVNSGATVSAVNAAFANAGMWIQVQSPTALAFSSVAPSGAASLGTRIGGFPLPGFLYEAWFSTTTPSDALFTEINQAVKAKTGAQW